MKSKTAVTTGQIAAHCQVAPETVINWIKSGKLTAYETPGGHRRIPLDQFQAFLQAHDMPPFTVHQPGKRKILVVDDEPGVVRTVVKLLGRSGEYEIATAADGFEAGIQVEGFCPDLIVLDLLMPQLGGFQVCRRIKSTPKTRHIKILVLTGYASDENVRRALECGADGCLEKPFKMVELKKSIEALFEGTYKIASLTA